VNSPVEVQQLDGMEGAGPDVSLPDVSGPAFHLARLWPIMVWSAQKCRVCFEVVEQEDAVAYDKPPHGWQHREGECG